jgi:hypothetical protein
MAVKLSRYSSKKPKKSISELLVVDMKISTSKLIMRDIIQIFWMQNGDMASQACGRVYVGKLQDLLDRGRSRQAYA